jgi:hypothetical protein
VAHLIIKSFAQVGNIRLHSDELSPRWYSRLFYFESKKFASLLWGISPATPCIDLILLLDVTGPQIETCIEALDIPDNNTLKTSQINYCQFVFSCTS